VKGARVKSRTIAWVSIPAIVLGTQLAVGENSIESPLLLAGGLAGLGGLTLLSLLSERWRHRQREGVDRSETPAEAAPDETLG